MTKFNFRIRFHLHRGARINYEGASLDINVADPDRKIELKSTNVKKSISEETRLVLTGGPFATYDEAELSGKRAKGALMLYSIRNRVGLDIGKDIWAGGLTNNGKKHLSKEMNVRILHDIHGLSVYESSVPSKFANIELDVVVGHSVDKFVEEFQHSFPLIYPVNEKIHLAFELFSSSYFEESMRARFLALVMSIESLMKPTDRSQAVKAHIQSLLDITSKSNLKKHEKDSISGSLRKLFKESIGQSGKKMAVSLLTNQNYGGRSAEAFFSYCYKLRSQLVHDGCVKDENELKEIMPELEKFVSDLLDASIKGL